MTVVLLDTNMLLAPHQHGVDIFSEIERLVREKHEISTLSTVIAELKGLSASTKSEDGIAANVGLRLITEKAVGVIPSHGPVDDAIVEYAAQNKAIVCTNDRELKSRLREKELIILSMRGKNHLEIA